MTNPQEASAALGARFARWTLFLTLVLIPFSTIRLNGVAANAVWLGSLVVFSGFYLATEIVHTKPRYAHLMFWLFNYIWLALAPFVQYVTSSIPSQIGVVKTDLIPLAATVTLLSWMIAQYSSSRHARAVLIRDDTGIARQIAKNRNLVLIWSFGFGFTLFYISTVGIGNLFSSRDLRTIASIEISQESSLGAIFSSMAWVPTLAVSLLLLARAQEQKKISSYALAFLAAVPALLVTNPLSSARYVAAAAWGGFALAFLARAERRAVILATKLSVSMGFLFVFPWLSIFRREGQTFQGSDVIRNFYFNGDYDAFWSLVNSIEYMIDKGAVATSQFLGPVLFWFPRSFWPSKPQDSGVVLAQFKGLTFTNLSAPLQAESILAFSAVGLLLYFYWLGKALAIIDGPKVLNWVTSPFLAVYLVIVLRGSLLQATGAIVLFIGVNLIMNRGLIPTSKIKQKK